MALGTAHDRVDAGDQLIAVEGFGDIVVGAEAQCADLGIHLADAGENQHRRSDLGDAELLQHVVAVHVGQVQIEADDVVRSEEHTSELQSLMRNSYAVFCLKKKNNKYT